MKIRKTVICLLLAVPILLLCACSGAKYNDGVYTAQMREFSANGWKDTMEVTIKGGKLVKINWDSIYKDDSIPIRKKQYSKSGLYGMLQAGAIGEWYDQAVAAEQFVLENGVDALNVKSDGYTDAVSGCTIEVNEFEELILGCLEQAKR